jgi:hypothetical protein
MTTQAAQLIAAIRRRPSGMTYGQLQDLHISTSPQKRLAEAGWRYLRPGELLSRTTGRDGLVRFVIVRAKKSLQGAA